MTKTAEKQLINRLHRIAGQVGGIEKMLKENSEPSKILVQLDAVKASIDSLKRNYMKELVRYSISTEIEKILQIL